MPELTDLEQIIAPPAEEVAPLADAEVAEEAQAAAELSAEGAVPEVGEASLAAADASTTEPSASEQAFDAKPVADTSMLDSGMHRPEDYQAICNGAGAADRWDPKFESGHTQAQGWVQPYESHADMTFALKPGMSASQGLTDFLRGPTIADFRVMSIASELDDLRTELGEQRFDELFGSTDTARDAKISGAQRLRISADMYSIPFVDEMMALAEANEAADQRPHEPLAPVVEERVEEKPQVAELDQPAPELIAEELGMQREREQQLA